MKMINDNEYFQSSDLALVAVLLSFGYSIGAVGCTNGPRMAFYVLRDQFLDEKVQAFWAHTLTVDPLVYFNCLKEAKTRLYNNDID